LVDYIFGLSNVITTIPSLSCVDNIEEEEGGMEIGESDFGAFVGTSEVPIVLRID
jgi:hypothetical protein